MTWHHHFPGVPPKPLRCSGAGDKVVLHNDDFTPMEFVVEILESVFNRSGAESTRIMLTVHRSGIGVAGVFSREIAEAKAIKTIRFARESGYPLLCTTEPE